ncbi:MAG: hypothetical protein ACOC0V_01460 [Oceanicaulis sp.]
MSFEEKSNLATLGVLLLVFGGYFLSLGLSASSGAVPGAAPGVAFGPVIVGLTIGLVIWMIVTHVVLAILFSRDAQAGPDERDRTIERQADAEAGYVLGFGVITTLVLLITDVSGYWIAHALLGALVLSEVYKGLRRAIAYRSGA